MVSLKDWARLSRAPLAPTAACDALACGLLARSSGFFHGGEDGFLAPAPMLLLAATSVLVYAAGMAGNDLADRRRDETLYPDRPLASGRIRPAAAIVFVLACAAGALAIGGGPFGNVACIAAALGCAAAYDGGLKRFPWVGSVAMGAVRASNASIAVLPLVLARQASPFALLPPLAIGAYSAAVTILSTTEGHEAPRRALASRVLAAIAVAGAGLLSVVGARDLTFGALLAFGVVSSIAFGRVPRKGPAKAQVLEMLFGIYFLDAAIASGASWTITFAALGAAFALIYVSQIAVFQLRR